MLYGSYSKTFENIQAPLRCTLMAATSNKFALRDLAFLVKAKCELMFSADRQQNAFWCSLFQCLS